MPDETIDSQPAKSPSEVTPTVAAPTLPTNLGPSPSSEKTDSGGQPAGFTILREHARGGLGKISLARDERLQREVALKEIRREWSDDPQFRRRFLVEAEITSQLEHPGIVPVYALQEDAEGRPYYAMRFIQGRTLGEAISAYYQEPDALAFRDLLRRFVQICQTIAYAHSRGVLHRDLKPSNVMLGEYGETLVLDWGLAKRLGGERAEESSSVEGSEDESDVNGQTRQGQVIGTPNYMAPEQAQGRQELLGPATDIFALGAILFEVLTGKAPLAGLSVCDVLRQRQEEPPPSPSSLRKDVPPALEAICRRAMALSIADRYSSASEVGHEVDRWLADEPVRAYCEPWTGRLSRWSRRHRLLVASAAVLLLTSVLGLAVGLWAVRSEQRRTEHQKQSAERNAEAAREQQIRAETSYRLARAALDRCMELKNDPRLKRGDLQDLQIQFAKAQKTFFEQFTELRGDDRAFRAEHADAFFQLGQVTSELGSRAEAIGYYEQSAKLFQELAEEDPDHLNYVADVGNALNNLGSLYRDAGRFNEAEKAYLDALKIRDELVRLQPDDPRSIKRQIGTMNNLGLLSEKRDRLEDAEKFYRSGLDLVAKETKRVGETPLLRQVEAELLHNLGGLLNATGRLRDAAGIYERGRDSLAELLRQQPQEAEFAHNLSGILMNLGNTYDHLGRIKDAEEAYRKSLNLCVQLNKNHPRVSAYRQRLSDALHNLGHLLGETGRLSDAVKHVRRAIDVRAELARDFPEILIFQREQGISLNRLANFYVRLGQYSEAEDAYRKNLELQSRLAEKHPDVADYQQQKANALINLGSLFRKTSRLRDAETHLKQALTLYEDQLRRHPRIPECKSNLVETWQQLALVYHTEQPEKALAAYQQAIRIGEELVQDHPEASDYQNDLALRYNGLGAFYDDSEKPAESLEPYRKALGLWSVLVEKNPTVSSYQESLASTFGNLGLAYHHVRRWSDAEAAQHKALKLQEMLARENSDVLTNTIYLANTRLNVGNLTCDRGDPAAALDWYNQASNDFEAVLKRDARQSEARQFGSETYWSRAAALNLLGRHAEAKKDLDRALRICSDDKRNWLLVLLAATRIRLGETEKALSTVEEQLKKPKPSGDVLYAAACVYAAIGAKAERADKAMHLLKQAQAADYFKNPIRIEQMKKDRFLDDLRRREDFTKLLKELEAQLPTSNASEPGK